MYRTANRVKHNPPGNMFSLAAHSPCLPALRTSDCKHLQFRSAVPSTSRASLTETPQVFSAQRRKPIGKRDCRLGALAVEACGMWIRKQLSTEMGKHVVSSAGTAAAYLITMTLCVAIATLFTLIRFYVRARRRDVAQKRRVMARLGWVRHRVQRAAVLGQEAEKWTRPEDYIVAARLLHLHNIFLQHSLSLAEAASHLSRSPRMNARHVLSVCFRNTDVDNWRLMATGEALYKTVHSGGELGVCEVGWDAIMDVPEIERESSKTGKSGLTSSYRTSCVPSHMEDVQEEDSVSLQAREERKRAVHA